MQSLRRRPDCPNQNQFVRVLWDNVCASEPFHTWNVFNLATEAINKKLKKKSKKSKKAELDWKEKQHKLFAADDPESTSSDDSD